MIMDHYDDNGPVKPKPKSLLRPHLNRKKLIMVVDACHPSNGGKPKIEG
jgi:hypothetical protein